MEFIEWNKSLICVMPKTLNTVVSQEIESELNGKIDSANGKIVFDFKDVEFVSSYFLRICLNVYKKVGSDNFEISNIKSELKKVFMIAGFDKYINISSE